MIVDGQMLLDEHRTVAGCGLQFSARAVFGSVCFRATPVAQWQQEYDGLTLMTVAVSTVLGF